MYENVEPTVKEMNDIKEQIKLLVPFSTEIYGMSISVTYNMTFMMIDGNVCNAVIDTNICATLLHVRMYIKRVQ